MNRCPSCHGIDIRRMEATNGQVVYVCGSCGQTAYAKACRQFEHEGPSTEIDLVDGSTVTICQRCGQIKARTTPQCCNQGQSENERCTELRDGRKLFFCGTCGRFMGATPRKS
jgi:hypothetical protein